MAGGIAMKHTLFAHICLITLLSSSFGTLTRSPGLAAIINSPQYRAEQTDSDKIAIPTGTDAIVESMLFGTGNPKTEAKRLLHNIMIALKDNPSLSNSGRKRLNEIKAILKRCTEDNCSIGDWIAFQGVNFVGILNKNLLSKIDNHFNGRALMSFTFRLQSA